MKIIEKFIINTNAEIHVFIFLIMMSIRCGVTWADSVTQVLISLHLQIWWCTVQCTCVQSRWWHCTVCTLIMVGPAPHTPQTLITPLVSQPSTTGLRSTLPPPGHERDQAWSVRSQWWSWSQWSRDTPSDEWGRPTRSSHRLMWSTLFQQ